MVKQGWVVEKPFMPRYIRDGHFIMQMRRRGESMTEMYSTIVETLHEVTQQGKC
jgi:hypothetical protein